MTTTNAAPVGAEPDVHADDEPRSRNVQRFPETVQWNARRWRADGKSDEPVAQQVAQHGGARVPESAQGPGGKRLAARSLVGEFNAFAVRGKNHGVIAYHIAAPERVHPDLRIGALTDDAVPAVPDYFGQLLLVRRKCFECEGRRGGGRQSAPECERSAPIVDVKLPKAGLIEHGEQGVASA